jgi:hypothetical protein
VEVEVTSENGVEQLSFRCSCGASIKTTEKKETCPKCGRDLEVIGCRETPKGKKYTLRITKRRNAGTTESFHWPLNRSAPLANPMRQFGTDPNYTSQLRNYSAMPPKQHRVTPDYNKRYTRAGLLTFLLIGLVVIASNISPERLAILRTPEPRDCDWITLPLGDKHCHYERTVTPVGDQFKVTFQRFIDY